MTEQEDDTFGQVISKYTARDAVEDGIFVEVGSAGDAPIYFTTNLFESGGYRERQKRADLVMTGIELLKKPDPKDSDYIHLRVIEEGQIWVVYNGEGITFMRPEDY
jgi:hypothetical protein